MLSLVIPPTLPPLSRISAELAAIHAQVVAFNEELATALTRHLPAARAKLFLIPQAVELATPEDAEDATNVHVRPPTTASMTAPSPAPTTAPASPHILAPTAAPTTAPMTAPTTAPSSAPSSAGAASDPSAEVARAARAARTLQATGPRLERLLAALDLAPTEHLLLLPAGVRPVKDVLWAALALAQWHRAEPRVCLRIVGPVLDESYAVAVTKALTSLGASSRAVRYCGALPRAQLHAAMAHAKVVLNTSESEGMCNSLLEAMLVGTPVLARANKGNAALITDGRDGLLCRSPEELVAKVSVSLAFHDLLCPCPSLPYHRPSITFCGLPSPSVAFHHLLWPSVTSNGFLWPSVAFRWPSVGLP